MKKFLIGVLLGCVLVTGCGNSAASTASYDAAPAAATESAAEAYYEDDSWYNDAESEVAMEESIATTGVTFAQDKKIIYKSNVVLETKTYTETYTRLVDLINKNNGYIEYENYNNEKRSYLANNDGKGTIVIATNILTIRIPSKNYATFMQEGLELGNVLQRNQTIEDKTSEYNTNKSYVDILNDEAEYLAKQLDVLENELKEAQANDRYYDEIIENMKDIAERKAQVEKELVPYKRTMDDIDEMVAYSTIKMELREVDKFTVIEVEEEEEEVITFGTQLKETWTKSMNTLGSMLKGTLLFLINILPGVVYLLLFGTIVFFIWKLVKKILNSKAFGKLTSKDFKDAPTAPMWKANDKSVAPKTGAASKPVAPMSNAGTKPVAPMTGTASKPVSAPASKTEDNAASKSVVYPTAKTIEEKKEKAEKSEKPFANKPKKSGFKNSDGKKEGNFSSATNNSSVKADDKNNKTEL